MLAILAASICDRVDEVTAGNPFRPRSRAAPGITTDDDLPLTLPRGVVRTG